MDDSIEQPHAWNPGVFVQLSTVYGEWNAYLMWGGEVQASSTGHTARDDAFREAMREYDEQY